MFWTYLWTNRSWLLLMTVFIAISAACSGALTLSIKPAFDRILTSSVTWPEVYTFLATIVAIFVGKGIGQFGERLCVARIVSVTIDKLQKQLMTDVLHKPFSFFQTISSGELTSRIVGDAAQIKQHLVNVVLVVGKESITAVVLFGVLLWMDWLLSLSLLIVTPMIGWPIATLTKRMRHMTTLSQNHNGQIAGQLGALFNFIKTIKACGAENRENARFRAANRTVEKYWRRAFWFHAWNFPLMELGAVDMIIGRLVELWSSIPSMFLVLIIVSLIRPNFWLLLGICLMFNWIQVAAVTRAEFLRIREQDYVRAAEIMGLSRARIMLRHILPNAVFGILVYFPYLFTNAIVQLTALTFLGFGLPPETASLGDLLNQAKDNLSSPWIGVSAIMTLVIVLTLLMTISEKLRDVYKKSVC